jgi:hypothetical protein
MVDFPETVYADSLEMLDAAYAFLEINPTVFKGIKSPIPLDCDMYLDLYMTLMDNAAEFVRNGYSEYWECEKWFLSSRNMDECYRLRKAICRLKGIRRRDDPFAVEARQYIWNSVDFDASDVGLYLETKTRRQYDAHIIVRTGIYFCAPLKMAVWLAKVFDWFDRQVVRLRAELGALHRERGALLKNCADILNDYRAEKVSFPEKRCA